MEAIAIVIPVLLILYAIDIVRRTWDGVSR